MNVEFFAYFIMFLAFALGTVSIWVMYDLDRYDKPKHKTKKA
jgi:hypothetical protein